MKTHKNMQYLICLIILFTLVATAAQAQILPPPGPGAGGGGTNVPLDPMSWALLGGAGAYAVKQYRKRKANEDANL